MKDSGMDGKREGMSERNKLKERTKLIEIKTKAGTTGRICSLQKQDRNGGSISFASLSSAGN